MADKKSEGSLIGLLGVVALVGGFYTAHVQANPETRSPNPLVIVKKLFSPENIDDLKNKTAEELKRTQEDWNEISNELTDTPPEAQTASQVSESGWSFEKYPDYYAVLGKSSIDINSFPKKGEIFYNSLDSLGRTQEAKASLTFDNVKSSYGKREKFSKGVIPSGWAENQKVAIPWKDNKIYHGYFWNKSHLIADSLGGKAIRENVITGTRTQNVGGVDQKGGMRYVEKKAQSYLEAHHDIILYYSVKPIYNENELIPKSVVVDMLSSDGIINEQVEIFNTANSWSIDYSTGQYYQE